MNKARETRERHTDKFHNSMSSLGFEPPNHGISISISVILRNNNVIDMTQMSHACLASECFRNNFEHLE